MSDWNKVYIPEKAYRLIYEMHRDSLVVFSSYTNLDPKRFFTEWGFKNDDFPMIGSDFRENRNEFWMCVGKIEHE